nr:protein PAF1 homolog [Penaeus vannamei]
MDGGEINVKAVNDRELVVSGHTDKKEGGAKSSKRFLRRFVVPGDIQLDAVTSVMSSDGVLTVSAPKKHSTLQIEEVFSPISIDGSEKKLTSPGATKDNSQYALHNGQGSPEAPPTMPSGATASPVSQQIFTGQNPDSPNKEDSYPHVTSAEGMHVPPDPQPPSFPAPLKRVSTKPKGKEANEGAEEKVDYQAETPKPSSSSAPSKSVSVKPKSFDRKGREGSEEEEKVDYQAALKPRTAGGKFPIKISGTVINSNAV